MTREEMATTVALSAETCREDAALAKERGDVDTEMWATLKAIALDEVAAALRLRFSSMPMEDMRYVAGGSVIPTWIGKRPTGGVNLSTSRITRCLGPTTKRSSGGMRISIRSQQPRSRECGSGSNDKASFLLSMWEGEPILCEGEPDTSRRYGAVRCLSPDV